MGTSVRDAHLHRRPEEVDESFPDQHVLVPCGRQRRARREQLAVQRGRPRATELRVQVRAVLAAVVELVRERPRGVARDREDEGAIRKLGRRGRVRRLRAPRLPGVASERADDVADVIAGEEDVRGAVAALERLRKERGRGGGGQMRVRRIVENHASAAAEGMEFVFSNDARGTPRDARRRRACRVRKYGRASFTRTPVMSTRRCTAGSIVRDTRARVGAVPPRRGFVRVTT
eukprot:31481-Pelagococcus_subviridis.AAC.9